MRVRVRARVDSSGNVAGAKLDSAGPSAYFAQMALQAARGWKFKPPNHGGRDVSSEWSLRFSFTQSGTKVSSVRTDP
ncbi:MAG: TonB family protein [Bryobacteraceae bacterium]